MKLNLDTPSPDFDEEQKAQLERDNVAALRKTLNKTACQILYQSVSNTSTGLTATTYKLIGEATFTASGGLIEIDWYTSVGITASSNFMIKLIVDENESLSRIARVDCGDTLATYVALHFKKALGEGRHKVQIYAKVDGGGAATYSTGPSTTELIVKETLL